MGVLPYSPRRTTEVLSGTPPCSQHAPFTANLTLEFVNVRGAFIISWKVEQSDKSSLSQFPRLVEEQQFILF